MLDFYIVAILFFFLWFSFLVFFVLDSWVGAGLFFLSLSVSILCVWRGAVSRYVFFFLYLWIVAFCFAIIYSHMSTTATFHPFSLFPQTLLDLPSRLSLPKMVMVLALGETKRQIEGKPIFPTLEERPRGLRFVLFCPKFIRRRFPFFSLSLLLFLFPRHSLLLTHSLTLSQVTQSSSSCYCCSLT